MSTNRERNISIREIYVVCSPRGFRPRARAVSSRPLLLHLPLRAPRAALPPHEQDEQLGQEHQPRPERVHAPVTDGVLQWDGDLGGDEC